MRRSEKTSTLMKSIAKARQNFRTLKMNSKNPHFKSDYADLDEVLDVLKKPLYDAGVSFNQFPDTNANGQMVLTTVLMHWESEEFTESDFLLILDKQTSQGQGSAITYARRYSLTSIFGLHEFDDDGNIAEAKPQEEPQKGKKSQVENIKEKIAALPVFDIPGLMYKLSEELIVDLDQLRVIYHELREKGIANHDMEKHIRDRLKF